MVLMEVAVTAQPMASSKKPQAGVPPGIATASRANATTHRDANALVAQAAIAIAQHATVSARIR